MNNIQKVYDKFIKGETGSVKSYELGCLVATKNAIVFRQYVEYHEHTVEEILAVKIGNSIIGNSSGLDVLRRAQGSNQGVTDEQTFLSNKVTMIPFEVMKQAGLSLKDFREIDKGPEETIYLKDSRSYASQKQFEELKNDKTLKNFKVKNVSEGYNKEKHYDLSFETPRHFTGARLFSVGPKTFLLDVDRVELSNGIVNPFLVELPKRVKTIADAYESLKPQIVKDAEIKGQKFHRQGEWFFTPVDDLTAHGAAFSFKKRVDLILEQNKNSQWFDKKTAGRGVLRVGRNRPNAVTCMVEIDGKFYVKGTVSHTGREHKDLELKQWHLATPNTASTSWTITGDID